jgi:hypothetical protein
MPKRRHCRLRRLLRDPRADLQHALPHERLELLNTLFKRPTGRVRLFSFPRNARNSDFLASFRDKFVERQP